MAIAHSHLQAAGRILSGYDGRSPFPEHARGYFRVNKQHGGRDRRSILAMCYANLRIGASLPDQTMEIRTIIGLFLSLEAPDRMLQDLDASWNALLPMALEEKLGKVKERHPSFMPDRIFSWGSELGGDIDPAAFSRSHLVQPDLFVRLRPGKGVSVKKQLDEAGLVYESVGTSALRFRSGTDVSKIFTADKELVIQDLSSQSVAEVMKNCAGGQVWDCCAGSGGKTILVHDLFPEARINASDIRPSILQNLRARLEAAGISGVKTFESDLATEPLRGHAPFDMVIADVPCTGSGTWGRNPEWLTHFDPSAIPAYASKQKAIARHATMSLKAGGCFIYITCSVFRAENEEVVEHLCKHAGLKLEEMRYLTGFIERADSLFAARLTSPA